MSASAPGLGDRPQECGDPAVVAAQLEDLLDHRPVLALELAGALVGRGAVVDGLDLDRQLAARPGRGRPREPAMQAGQRDRADAAGQPAALDHVGDRADARVLALVTRDDENALGVAGLGRDRGGHAGEEDAVVEGNQRKLHQANSRFRR